MQKDDFVVILNNSKNKNKNFLTEIDKVDHFKARLVNLILVVKKTPNSKKGENLQNQLFRTNAALRQKNWGFASKVITGSKTYFRN